MSRKKRGQQIVSNEPRHGFPLENLTPEAFEFLFEALARRPAPRTGKSRRLAALREILQDADRWDEWLAELPALSLVALEILVEACGGLETEDIEDILQRRIGCDDDQARVAWELLCAHQLVVPLGSHYEHEPVAISIYEGTLPLLTQRLRGASLPAVPAEFAQESDECASDVSLCHTLAVAGLTAHRRLGFTRAGAPNRTSLRRFAKDLGASPDEVFALVERAMRRDWVRAKEQDLTPNPQRMLTAARAGGDDSAFGSGFDSWLQPGAWVSLDALLRARVRAHLDTSLRSKAEHGHASVVIGVEPLFGYFEEQMRNLEGLEHRIVANVAWVRRPKPPGEFSGDGHVTPNFEVMLGPSAHPEIVASVALGCELQRIDRVLTFRITPQSVAAGMAAGQTKGQLCAALEAVGPHALAKNVAQLVDEWEQASRVARVSHGWFLFAGNELQPLLEKGELAPHLLGSPAPGVLELDPSTPRQLIASMLAEHGAQLSLSYPLASAEEQRRTDRLAGRPAPAPPHEFFDLGNFDDVEADGYQELDGPSRLAAEPLLGIEPPWSLAPAGASTIRERLALARTSGFAEELLEHAELVARAGVTSGSLEQQAAEQLIEIQDLLKSLKRAASRELSRFRRKLSGPERDHFDAVCSGTLALCPFLTLKPKWRRRAALAAENLDELLEWAADFSNESHLSSEGKRLLALVHQSHVSATLPPETTGARDEAYEFHPSVEFPGANPNEKSRGPHPAESAFPVLESNELLSELSAAVRSRRSVFALVESDTGTEVQALRLERIKIEGGRQVLLAEDMDRFERRVVPVRSIRSLLY